MKLVVANLAKEFNRRAIFSDVSFSLELRDSLAITGMNGAGKSTLVKILAGLLSETRGSIEYSVDGKAVPVDMLRDQIGLVSPYLMLYDEFTAKENLSLLSRIRSNSFQIEDRSRELLQQFGLWEKRDEFVRTYSSGMKQRLKFVFALLHQPVLLFVDEPTSNLDEEGVSLVRDVIEQQKKDRILVVATNIHEEAGWCSKRIHLKKI
ncbi:MAG: ABC transporter ATP-binding protein [Ignavibacteriae bacterium]|nr:ABC transporter ATP-binding protein [Ignavibacteriota bacterium]